MSAVIVQQPVGRILAGVHAARWAWSGASGCASQAIGQRAVSQFGPVFTGAVRSDQLDQDCLIDYPSPINPSSRCPSLIMAGAIVQQPLAQIPAGNHVAGLT